MFTSNGLLSIGEKVLRVSLLTCLVLITSVKAPEMHYGLLRSYVSNKVVRITNEQNSGGGTGFHVQTPNGGVYLLTNKHICDMDEGSNSVYVELASGRRIQRKIVERSQVTDLCLVEAMPNAAGLKVGSSLAVGTIVAAVGHPSLQPITMTRGEIVGQSLVKILDHLMDPSDENDKCSGPNSKVIEVQMIFWRVKACVVEIKANLSNIEILGGSSGSPLVNFWGEVVGVAFANDERSNWGAFVTLEDIKDFLRPY